MTVLLFLGGFAVGVAAGVAWVAYYTTPTGVVAELGPSRFTAYRGGYREGHADGKVGIWRGGPLQ